MRTLPMLLLGVALLPGSVFAQTQPHLKYFATTQNGIRVEVEEEQLCDFDLRLRQWFFRQDAPNEIIAFASARPSDISFPDRRRPVELLILLIYEKRAECRWYLDDQIPRFYRRVLNDSDVENVRTFLKDYDVLKLPELIDTRPNAEGFETSLVGGTQHVLLHVNAERGIRLAINNPPDDVEQATIPANDVLWKYVLVTEFFQSLKEPKRFTMQYEFERSIPNLQVLFADPQYEAIAVWMSADQKVCVTIRNGWGNDATEHHRVLNDRSIERVAPRQRLITSRDDVNGSSIAPACASPDGRWVIGNSTDTGVLVCYDSLMRSPVAIPTEIQMHVPICYLDYHKAYLLCRSRPEWLQPSTRDDYRLFDPANGSTMQVDDNGLSVDLCVWQQMMAYELQPVHGIQNAVWLATIDGRTTKIGQYDTATFRWIGYAWIPNLAFETRNMWIDEPRQKIYVVFKGHVLGIPLPRLLATPN